MDEFVRCIAFPGSLLIYIMYAIGCTMRACNNRKMYIHTDMLDDDGGEVSYQAIYSFISSFMTFLRVKVDLFNIC